MTKEQLNKFVRHMTEVSGLSEEQLAEKINDAFDGKSRPFLPSNLDEAAQKVEDYYDVGEEHGYLCCHRGDIKDAFKAGAKWMAGQGYTKEETVYFERLCDENRIMVDLGWGEPERGGFNPGDKVVVQIRKK